MLHSSPHLLVELNYQRVESEDVVEMFDYCRGGGGGGGGGGAHNCCGESQVP